MHDFEGKWRITWAEAWPQDYVDLVEPGCLLFDEDNLGAFVYGAVRGSIDIRVLLKEPYLAYSWQGKSQGDDYCGRGWSESSNPNQGDGMLFIHCGDESAIKIECETQQGSQVAVARLRQPTAHPSSDP